MHTPRMPAVAEGQRKWLGRRQSGSSNAPDLHPKETWLLGLLAAQLIILPWALGSVHLWAQLVSLGLAIPAFAASLLPRHYNAELAQGPAFDLKLWPKLLRFPVFWFGLLFFAYVLIQLANPAWEYRQNEKGAWWLQPRLFVSWLPHGISGAPVTTLLVPPWQALLPLLAAFLSACAVWVGVTRRKTIVLLLTFLSANLAVLALVAIAQRLTSPRLIYWFYSSLGDVIAGSFIYRNHSAAYYNLGLAICCAVGLHVYERSERRLGKSNPGLLFVFVAVLSCVVVLSTYSRMGTALLAVFAILILVLFACRRLFIRSGHAHPAIAATLSLLFVGFLGLGAYYLKADNVLVRYRELLKQGSISVEVRSAATEATLKLAERDPLLGQGWGSFRYLFPSEQLQSTRKTALGVDAKGRIRSFWQHAHNDYAEYLMELGALGLIPATLCLLYFAFSFFRCRAWRHAPIVILLLGLVLAMLHSRVDFLVCNPAVFVTWATLWPLLLRWAEIENTSQALSRSRPL